MTVCREWTLTADRRFTGLCTMMLTAVTENDIKQCVVCVDPITVVVSHGVQTYDSGDGYWESPITGFVEVEYWGAGGGGGAGENGSNAGGSGGGSGEYRKINAMPVTLGQMVAYSIGSAGTKGTYPNDDATDGGDTTIDGTYVAKGGGRGRGQGDGDIVGAGGTGGSGGDVVTAGNPGNARTGNNGGAGGDAPNGGTGGTAGISTTTDGGAASAPAAGGGGGGKQRDGGLGASGRARFTW